MLKFTKLFCLSGLLFGFIAHPGTAFADTDYKCLHSCVQSGKSGSDCVAQCSYVTNQVPLNAPTPGPALAIQAPPAAAAPEQNHATGENHNVLPDIVLTDNQDLVLPPKKVAAPQETKDYKCIQQCLTTHVQYQMCEKNCTTSQVPGSQVIRQKPTSP